MEQPPEAWVVPIDPDIHPNLPAGYSAAIQGYVDAAVGKPIQKHKKQASYNKGHIDANQHRNP